MNPDFEVPLGHEPPGVGAKASTCRVVVKRAGSGWRGRRSVGIDARAEDPCDAENLIVSEAWFERHFGNKIRRDVRRVIGERVITTAAAVARAADQEVRRIPCAGQKGL